MSTPAGRFSTARVEWAEVRKRRKRERWWC
jgi:hypothetical protein